MQKFVTYSGYACVTAVIVASFLFVGSPLSNARQKADEDRLSQAEQIHCRLTNSYYAHGKMPKDLPTAYAAPVPETTCSNSCYDSTTDDAGESARRLTALQPFFSAYLPKKAPGTYHLCMQMQGDWDSYAKRNSDHMQDHYHWAKGYAAGEYCFTRTIPRCQKDKQ